MYIRKGEKKRRRSSAYFSHLFSIYNEFILHTYILYTFIVKQHIQFLLHIYSYNSTRFYEIWLELCSSHHSMETPAIGLLQLLRRCCRCFTLVKPIKRGAKSSKCRPSAACNCWFACCGAGKDKSGTNKKNLWSLFVILQKKQTNKKITLPKQQAAGPNSFVTLTVRRLSFCRKNPNLWAGERALHKRGQWGVTLPHSCH